MKTSPRLTGLFLLLAGSLSAATLDTDTHTLTVVNTCGEAVVQCDKVTLQAVPKKAGKTVSLTGKTTYTTDRSGAPAALLGYEFKDGGTVYFVSAAGSFSITRNGKQRLAEEGRWKKESTTP